MKYLNILTLTRILFATGVILSYIPGIDNVTVTCYDITFIKCW